MCVCVYTTGEEIDAEEKQRRASCLVSMGQQSINNLTESSV